MKNVCVIGGTSKLGRSICSVLSENFTVNAAGSFQCDVRDYAKIKDYFYTQKSIDGLIYCSALKSECDALGDIHELEKLLSVNLLGAIYCLQEAVKKMKKGKIVVIGSTDATFGNYKKTMYSVSKSALHTYTRCFAAQVRPNIETICVVPGTIKDENDKHSIAKFINAFMKDEISNLHSQLIRIDGGHHTFPL